MVMHEAERVGFVAGDIQRFKHEFPSPSIGNQPRQHVPIESGNGIFPVQKCATSRIIRLARNGNGKLQ